MDRFVKQSNIDRYRKLIAQTTDVAVRQTIQQLLDECENEQRKDKLREPNGRGYYSRARIGESIRLV